MARPRKVTDEQVFEAAYGLMQRLGPTQWTLADVAREVGVTPAALVQRYGSKRALQVALMAQFADAVPQLYAALRGQHASPLAALRAYADQVACLAGSPAELAHHLDYLRLDLTDPEMYVHFRRQAEAARAFVRDVIAEAVFSGELWQGTDVARLASVVEATITGSLFTWAVHGEGTARAWLRADLAAVLAPYAAEPA